VADLSNAERFAELIVEVGANVQEGQDVEVLADLGTEEIVRAIAGADKATITSARLFDRFESGDGLSLAVEVTLQPADKSFTETEIAEISKRIVAAAEKLGAKLRG